MDYAEGGTLWNPVLMMAEYQSRILNGGPPRSSVRFTARIRTSVRFVLTIVNNSQIQTVSFLFFRDIKPHNFVLTPAAHVLLIDFGSAAPLLPPNVDGSQSKYCLVPCGTCDYISPEILLAHENALLALENE